MTEDKKEINDCLCKLMLTPSPSRPLPSTQLSFLSTLHNTLDMKDVLLQNIAGNMKLVKILFLIFRRELILAKGG